MAASPLPKPDDPLSVAFAIPDGATIQGQRIGSVIEWFVALALDKLKLNYIYQYEVMGGNAQRGGQTIDFFVYTIPVSTPLEVNGDYWHRDPEKEVFDMGQLRRHFRGSVADPVAVWEHELLTPDMAYETVKMRLRV